MLVFIIFFVSTFVFMEFVAWFSHKYIMHGFLWSLHKDHHKKESTGFIERNDAFFLLFAIPAIVVLVLASLFSSIPLWSVGLGITAYGCCYFLVHDVLIHRRLKWFRKTNLTYLKGLRKAHLSHHKHIGKEDGECFGMLVVPTNYFSSINKK